MLQLPKLPQSIATDTRHLTKPAARKTSGLLLVEGVKCCNELLNSSNFKVEYFVFAQDNSAAELQNLFKIVSQRNLRAYTTRQDKLAGLCDAKSPQGVIAVARQIAEPKLQTTQSFVALDNVSDPGNVGTIIRTCEWFDIKQVLLVGECADYRSPKVIRSAMGSTFRMNIVAIESNANLLKRHFTELPLFAATLGGSVQVSEIKPVQPFGLIVGNESRGVSMQFAEMATCFRIPGSGAAESLNVAVATGIALYELLSK